MGAANGFALSQHALVTFAVFTALALGLALPYLALTWVPGWASKLPRPGRWMETLKQLTAIPLFLTVVWLVWVSGHLTGSSAQDGIDHVARLLVGSVILAIARVDTRALARTTIRIPDCGYGCGVRCDCSSPPRIPLSRMP